MYSPHSGHLLQVKHVVPDRLLVQLLTAWLSPDQAIAPDPRSQGTQTCTPFNPKKCCKAQLGIAVMCAEDCAKQVIDCSQFCSQLRSLPALYA